MSKQKTSISLEKRTLKRIDRIAAAMKPPVSRSALIDQWLMDRFLRERGIPAIPQSSILNPQSEEVPA